MKPELEQARQAAAELGRLERARADLPRLEAEERARAISGQAALEGRRLEARLEAELAQFRELKARSDARFGELLAEAAEAVRERRALAERAARIKNLAITRAGQQWRGDNPTAEPVAWVADAVRGQAEQYLIDRGFRGAVLMTLARPGDDLERTIAGLLGSRLTGDVLEQSPGAGAFAGRVQIVAHDGQEYWG